MANKVLCDVVHADVTPYGPY